MNDLQAILRGLRQNGPAQIPDQDDETNARRVLGAMVRNPDLMKDFATMMQGRIVIHNYRGRTTPIYINGIRWNALYGESYIYAPVGRVAFQEPSDSQPEFRYADDWARGEGEMVLTYKIK